MPSDFPGQPAAAAPPANAQPAPAAPAPPPQAKRPHDHSHDFWLDTVVPLCSSLFIHVVVVLVILLTYKGAQQLNRMVSEEQTIIPDATLIDGAAVGGIPNPGLGADPTRSAASDLAPDASAVTSDFSDKASSHLNRAIMGSPEKSDPTESMIGIGGLSASAGERVGSGGNGQGGGYGTLPFGVPGGGAGVGPRSPFMGISGNARRVAYVCDASGSMVNRMAALKNELKKSVGVLQPIQAYNVIFFQEEKVRAASVDSLLMATPANKARTADFLAGVVARGGTDPVPSLTLAFHQHAQLIYLLTDGDFPDNDKVLKAIHDLNRDRKVKINTIAFISDADQEAAKGFVQVLQQIAKENGGQFRLVTESDVE